MKIFILTLGTRGDVELFVTLGRELARRGHRVMIGTSPFYAGRIRSAGLEHVDVGLGTRERMAGILRSLAEINDAKARTHAFIQNWVVPQLKEGMGNILPCASSADYFISNLNLDLPLVTRNVPIAFVTYDVPAEVQDLARRSSPDHGRNVLELVAMNRMLVDPDRRWGPHLQFTGFWLETSPGFYAPPRDLMRFLVGGAPPVVITLGSMYAMQAGGLIDRLVDAVRRAGQRALIVDRAADANTVSNDVFHPREEVPFSWLFSRCSMVIHHGGIGTVAASLASGKPSIILPHIAAQWRIAQTLHDAGVTTGVFDPAAMDPGALLTAINEAMHGVHVQDSAGKWKRLVSQDGGVIAAADCIERHKVSRGQ